MKYKESSCNNLAIANSYEINCPKGFSNLKRVKLLICMLISIHFKKWQM